MTPPFFRVVTRRSVCLFAQEGRDVVTIDAAVSERFDCHVALAATDNRRYFEVRIVDRGVRREGYGIARSGLKSDFSLNIFVFKNG